MGLAIRFGLGFDPGVESVRLPRYSSDRASLATFITPAAGCGPISVLGQYASDLIGGLAALRMLKATFISVVSASLGGTSAFSQALIECGEAIFGMLIAAAAIPLAAWFLGTC
ncbi:MAG: hypothetical protein M5U11_00455 [Anaerolineales bacterium]|nr:hypothetical protein [Anaerolineales bacterium]